MRLIHGRLRYSFHKQDKIFASDLYGRLQWLTYWLAIVNAHTDLPLIFYLLHKGIQQFIVCPSISAFVFDFLHMSTFLCFERVGKNKIKNQKIQSQTILLHVISG